MQNLIPQPILNSLFIVSLLLQICSVSQADVIMKNTMSATGERRSNKSFYHQTKNLLVFQTGGWEGLTTSAGHDPEWPLAGGKKAYLTRNRDSLLKQMDLIKGLGDTVAITVLLMNDGDSNASGYGTCWDGTWTSGRKCSGGKWTTPMQMYKHVKWAAWMKGIQVAPYMSMMNYEFPMGKAGNMMMPKIMTMLGELRQTFDAASLRTDDGRYVVVIDSLPVWAGMSFADKEAVLWYMNSQTDIFWINNIITEKMRPELYSNRNMHTAAAVYDTSGQTQDALRDVWKDKFLWWYVAKFASTFTESIKPTNNIPQSIRMKWMNIAPHDPGRYPVIISQWNEYAEYLIYEPSTKSGRKNYDYLKWMISLQP